MTQLEEVTPAGRLESALALSGDLVEAATRAATALTRELKRAKVATDTGQLRELRRALDAVSRLGDDLTAATAAAAASFTVDESAYLASGDYATEVLALAQARGVAMFESDGQLLCYPSLLRVLPGDAAVEVDRRREKRLRPSVLVGQLALAQTRPPRFRPGPFLVSLLTAYELVRRRADRPEAAVLRLVDIYDVLTLLPGQAGSYSKAEFARDLYLLDQTGETTERSGRVLRFHASTGSRGAGTLTTVAQTGQQQLYWGISFAPPPTDAPVSG